MLNNSRKFSLKKYGIESMVKLESSMYFGPTCIDFSNGLYHSPVGI